jgi:hypothetical protein
MPIKNPQKCAEIRDYIDKWEKYWTINRSLYYEWIDFVMGDQWREDESKLFERYNKIPLVFNKLGVLWNHLLGEVIARTPNLQILPDEDVTVENATIREAIVRDISLNSDSKRIYQASFGKAAIGGYCGWRITSEYIPGTFLQEIKIYDCDDPNKYYWSIDAKHPCKIDGAYAGFKVRISRKKFREIYGRDIESQIGTTATTEDSTMAFADDDSITEIFHYEREAYKNIVYKLSDGSDIGSEEFEKLEKVKLEDRKSKVIMKDNQIVTVLKKREETKWKIKLFHCAGDFVLDEEYFPSEDLPIIFLDQKSYFTKQGQQITRSFFKDVKDAQKYLNYLKTQAAYLMKIGRYDQFMAPRKSVASPDVAAIWRDPSIVQGALIYDETPSGLKPEQIRPQELSASLIEEYKTTLMDIQSGTGMYQTQLGEMGNEISGTAIEARTQRGTKNTAIMFNSLDIAIVATGEIINQMIPKIYDTERSLLLKMPESDSKRITINKEDEYGLKVENDVRKGRYKIRLKPGPSYEGLKQEALASLQSVLQADRTGSVFPMIADLYAENLPLDNNLEIRNRLRTLVPENIIEAGKTGEPLPPKPQQPSPDMINAQLKQAELMQKSQSAEKDYQLKLKELELKQAELQRKSLETHQDMTLEWEKLQANKEQAAADLQETILRYQGESERIGADMQINHSDNLIKLLTHHPKHI